MNPNPHSAIRKPKSGRIARETKTIAAMIRLYCAAHHTGRGDTVCPHCRELLDYAARRLARCPFQEGKSACARCTVHCYQAGMRERIREVMRYAGPRMLLRHPILALRHMKDNCRKSPAKISSECKL